MEASSQVLISIWSSVNRSDTPIYVGALFRTMVVNDFFKGCLAMFTGLNLIRTPKLSYVSKTSWEVNQPHNFQLAHFPPFFPHLNGPELDKSHKINQQYTRTDSWATLSSMVLLRDPNKNLG